MRPIYLLDTDICSFVMKRRYPALQQRVEAFAAGSLKVSSITRFELEYGVRRKHSSADLERVVAAFLFNVEILAFDGEAARRAGDVRARLDKIGNPIGAYDLLIAGHALSLGATLVTHNLRELERVPELLVEDWTAP